MKEGKSDRDLVIHVEIRFRAAQDPTLLREVKKDQTFGIQRGRVVDPEGECEVCLCV